jgi:RNA polymerase subunit RPABC4/transcription elongation factor Spt4
MANSTEKTIGLIVLVIAIIFLILNVSTVFLYFLPGITHGDFAIGSFHILPKYFTLGLLPIILIFLWVFIIIWVYRDAERRAMSGVLWALLVFVGNIIGLIIYLIVRNDSLTTRGVETTVAEPCLNCGTMVRQHFEYCPGCGKKQKDSCPSCGKPVTTGWKVCPFCEAKLTDKK